MLCQECKKRNATVLYKKMIQGKVQEIRLCDICSAEKQSSYQQAYNMNQFLSGLLDLEKSKQQQNFGQGEELQCKECGMSYRQFREVGRFGCDHCYEAFRDKITPLLRKIHGNQVHRGKIPKRGGGSIHLKQKVRIKKMEMQQAIDKEAFEEAAKLRDEIRSLEEEID